MNFAFTHKVEQLIETVKALESRVVELEKKLAEPKPEKKTLSLKK